MYYEHQRSTAFATEHYFQFNMFYVEIYATINAFIIIYITNR